MTNTEYDVVIIGGGPGGYVCAIRAAQLGKKVACVEMRKTLGGTCLNVGCIPSKAMLHTSERFEDARTHFADIGIKTGKVELDLKSMLAHKDKVVADNTVGIDFLFKKNKIDRVVGKGQIQDKNTVLVTDEKGKTVASLKTKNIVIATGSDVTPLKGVDIDEKQIVSSTGALELTSVPKHMVVIGGGVIGLEMGTVWRRLGAKVTVVEFLDRILPGMDIEVSKSMKKILEKQGIEFKLSTKVTHAKKDKKAVELTLEPAAGGKTETLSADIVLLAIGRRPYTQGLGLENVKIECDDRGRIPINGHFATKVDNIYALGDVVQGPMLAHKAEEEGVIVAEHLAGIKNHIDYNLVPSVVYTWPEIAQVGKTEEQLKADGVEYKVGKFPYSANGRARAMNATDGFVKILADKKTDRILGAHILGAEAGTLIAELVLAMEFGTSAEDVALTCHAHPTLSEVIKEAALAVDGRQIHM